MKSWKSTQCGWQDPNCWTLPCRRGKERGRRDKIDGKEGGVRRLLDRPARSPERMLLVVGMSPTLRMESSPATPRKVCRLSWSITLYLFSHYLKWSGLSCSPCSLWAFCFLLRERELLSLKAILNYICINVTRVVYGVGMSTGRTSAASQPPALPVMDSPGPATTVPATASPRTCIPLPFLPGAEKSAWLRATPQRFPSTD